MTTKLAARLEAFLNALPHAHEDELINAVGIGTWRARHVRKGLERGVIVIHSSGLGLAFVEPKSHGICRECVDSKSRSICDHCACSLCSWFRMAEERSSPRVNPEKWQQLVQRLKTFEIGGTPQPATAPDILGDI